MREVRRILTDLCFGVAYKEPTDRDLLNIMTIDKTVEEALRNEPLDRQLLIMKDFVMYYRLLYQSREKLKDYVVE